MSKQSKTKPAEERPNPAPAAARTRASTTAQAAEDARDVRDAERASADAKRNGVYPWEWLKQEIE